MTPDDVPPSRGRVAVFGDVGGQAKQLRSALVALGADIETLALPPDLTVVQVGDLIHRGPDSPGAIDIVRHAINTQPRQWGATGRQSRVALPHDAAIPLAGAAARG